MCPPPIVLFAPSSALRVFVNVWAGVPGARSKLSGSVWISMKRVCRDVRTAKKQPIVRGALLWPWEGGVQPPRARPEGGGGLEKGGRGETVPFASGAAVGGLAVTSHTQR